jgi:hypothetical protein
VEILYRMTLAINLIEVVKVQGGMWDFKMAVDFRGPEND